MAQRSPFGRNEGFAYRTSGRCFRASLAVRFGRDVNPNGSCYSLRLQESTVAYADLREFVRKLEKEGELRRIRTEVDPALEITEVVQRISREAQRGAIPQGLKPRSCPGANVGAPDRVGTDAAPTHNSNAPEPAFEAPRHNPSGLGPALLFEKPKGSRHPLLINAFGSVRRMALAFEVNELHDVAERIQGFR